MTRNKITIMKKILLLLSILLITLCSTAFSQAISVTNLIEIGNGRTYVCASDVVFGNFIGKKVSESSATYVQYRTARRKALNRVLIFKSRKNRELSLRKLRRINKKIRLWRQTYRELKKCWKYAKGFNSLDPNQNPDIQRACEIISPATNAFTTSRIFNGTLCDLNKSPIVQLELYIGNRSVSNCSGTAVTKRAIITAAHCLDGRITSIKALTEGSEYESTEFYAHPNYGLTKDTEINDVAVILLNEDIDTDIFPPIKDISLTARELGIIAGYGYDEYFNAGELIAAPILIESFTNKAISIRYSNNNDFGNTCSGDSGGPLLIKRDNEWRLVGVTSNGVNTNCGAGDLSNFANLLDTDNISFFETYISNLY